MADRCCWACPSQASYKVYLLGGYSDSGADRSADGVGAKAAKATAIVAADGATPTQYAKEEPAPAPEAAPAQCAQQRPATAADAFAAKRVKMEPTPIASDAGSETKGREHRHRGASAA